MSDDFEIIQKRVEWVVLVEQVDQYGCPTGEIIHEKVFPTRDTANRYMGEISYTHPYANRLVYRNAENEYHRVALSRREVFVDSYREGAKTALQRYEEAMKDEEETNPIERLRFYCSLAMNGQDWLDVEPFFDDLKGSLGKHTTNPSEWKSIETAPKDNKRSLYLARIVDGELVELDFDGEWLCESESWEFPEVYCYWASNNGIEEPTHWAYQDEALPTFNQPTDRCEGDPADIPTGWREQFKEAVYDNLAAADNQDIPLEEYPDRILKVLDSIVGPRHPTVVTWRNDAIRACMSIAYKYCRDPESHKYLSQDLEALITATHPDEPVKVPSDDLKVLSDRAYCQYIDQMSRPECKGVEHKLENNKFGVFELVALNKAHEYLGRHRAFSEALALLARYGNQQENNHGN